MSVPNNDFVRQQRLSYFEKLGVVKEAGCSSQRVQVEDVGACPSEAGACSPKDNPEHGEPAYFIDVCWTKRQEQPDVAAESVPAESELEPNLSPDFPSPSYFYDADDFPPPYEYPDYPASSSNTFIRAGQVLQLSKAPKRSSPGDSAATAKKRKFSMDDIESTGLFNIEDLYTMVGGHADDLLLEGLSGQYNNEAHLLQDLPVTDNVDNAMQTHTTQQSLTIQTLTTLHSALKACPSEDTLEKDPYGLKVELMPHQKHALAWLLWRERERPSGGLLADDMGLGKTLTMISLVLKSRELEDKENIQDSEDSDEDEETDGWAYAAQKNKMPRGGTLVVCPASLVGQWEAEVNRRCNKGLLSVLLYHGTYRETRVKRIARKDIVITTYNLMGRESGVETAKNCTELKTPGPLHSIKWKRIILDEAHIVRNHKSQTALGVFALPGKHRWCLTGTPIQNKELDLFSLLKFLRCEPFDDLTVWKRWVDNKNAAGMQRLATMMKSLMLRRTKEQLHAKGALENLPTKAFEIVSVKLDPRELKIYKKVALFSSTLFMQFLGQRAEKEQLQEARYGQSNLPTWEQGDRPDNQFFTNEKVVEMYRKMKMKNTEVKSHQILVLLLRLRQICCHPGLVKEMLEKEDLSTAGVDEEEGLDDDLFSAMEKLGLEDEKTEENADTSGETSQASSVTDTAELCPENTILDFKRPSSKIRAVLDVLLEKVMETEDKAVVVSQWTSMLNIVRTHLQEMGVKCEMLCGSLPVPKRMEMVDEFNSKRNKFRVLLLSLTAGGVGLNLIGGNHLFLIDVHWNPQMEAQACDRIYRVGQTKPVHIYKFICKDTIEERIKSLQDHKLTLANNVLTGTSNTQASKLTLQDLKMLFGIGVPQPEFGFPQSEV